MTSRQRIAQLPQVPTVNEAGLPGYEITGWTGMLAPAGSPAEFAAFIRREFDKYTKLAKQARLAPEP